MGDAKERGVVAESSLSRWQAVYLVCKACGKRSKGPKRFKPKELARVVRRAAKQDDARPRVLMTNCLGLCPKSAVTLARVGAGDAWIVAVKSEEQADEFLKQQAASGLQDAGGI